MKKLFNFCGICSTLYLIAVLFEIVTRQYFLINEKGVDFSVYAWGGMFLLWCGALWRMYKGDARLAQFATFLSLTCMAFICCQYYLVTKDEDYGLTLRVLLGAEGVCVIVFAFLRWWNLFTLSLAAFLLAFVSPFLILPKFFMLAHIMMAMGSVAVIWGLSLVVSSELWRKWIVYCGIAVVCAWILFAGIIIYLRIPGIRFYESKVTTIPDDIKVSVIIPAYNAAETIERCLDSLRRQKLRDIEIIVVDDGSTDNTPDVLAKYVAHDARIRVIRQENAYIGAARNKGLKHAKGKYVGFVDSDDYVSEDFYEKLYQKAEETGKDVVMAPKVNVVRQTGQLYYTEYLLKKEFSPEQFEKPYRQVYGILTGYVWNKLYKREFLEKNNITFTTYRTLYEDSWFHALLATYLENLTLSDAGTYYYSRAERETVSMNSKRLSLNDEGLDLFADLDKFVISAAMSDDVRNGMLEFIKTLKERQLQNFYDMIKKEERPEFIERCKQRFDEKTCTFDTTGKWDDVF